MSLRDLATTSLCAPTGSATAAAPGASSSSNPLAQLADAVLPSSTQPQARPTPLQRNHAQLPASSSSGGVTYEDATLLHGDLTKSKNSVDHLPQESPNHVLQYPPHPPTYFSGLPAPLPVPPPAAPPQVPHPEAGAPTDVFEQAFHSARSSVPHVPSPGISHVSAGPPSTPAPAPHFMPVQNHHQHIAHPPWSHLPSAFEHLSLQSPQVHPYQPIKPNPTHAFAPPFAPIIPYAHAPAVPLAHPVPMQLQPAMESRPGPVSRPATTEITAATPSVTDAEVIATPKQPETSGALPHSASWGDEFTSLESVEPPLSASNMFEHFQMEDTLQSAFQSWLRRDRSNVYEFSHAGSSHGKSAAESLAEGLRAYHEGRFSAAVLHLEEALNRPDVDRSEPLSTENRSQAWYTLGLSLADLDDDERAIQALSQGINAYEGSQVGSRREDNPYLWQSLIALAVSYTNELEHTKALRVIREWLELHAASGDGEAGTAPSVGNVDLFRRSDHDDLLSALNRTAAESPNDVDIFIVLGILHNLNRDYTAAAVSLRHAVTLRPDWPSLWNKLGATLANGGESMEALHAYRKAVDLQPSLVRAWVNVGTAYANRSEFSKAMRYYLKALSMCETSDVSASASPFLRNGDIDSMLHVWGYVRSTLISLSQGGLLHFVEKRDVNGLRRHFNF